ncbi:MAG: cell division topological specificity factor MinE [Anaerolineae bacterium]|nr:cell division topological specificity factor MinE [Anaerolineae bacterium]
MHKFLQHLLQRRQTGSSSIAKERLQLVLVTDRSELTPEKMQQMKDEIIDVICKYVNVMREKVEINFEQRQRDNWLVADIPLLRSEMSPVAADGGEA